MSDVERIEDRLEPRRIPRRRDAAATTEPDVTVIVPVYNTMPYLVQCLTSLVKQTIGRDRMEVVAVDDGSTDGSGRELDRFARRHPGVVRVIHQANSGGPAGPCNRGLDAARGRYVYFVGADDYLGEQALARLVEAADRYGSDVVLGRARGVNSRYIHQEVYADTRASVDLFDAASGLRWSLANTKLFRRELIERHKLRFPEDMPVASDQPFTIEAIVRSARVSVLADYDYYYAVRRLNARNITYSSRHLERLRAATTLMDFVATLVEPGKRRDTVLYRHFSWELAKLLGDDFLRLDRDVQEQVRAGIGELVGRYLTDDIRGELDIETRLRLCAARDGSLDELIGLIRQDAELGVPPTVVAGDRRLAGYPGAAATGEPGHIPAQRSWRDVTDVAANWAAKFDVVSARTGTAADGARVLVITARSPQPDLADQVTEPVRITAEGITAETVSVTPGTDGTLVRVELKIKDLVEASAPLGHRWNLRARVAAYGGIGSAALRGPRLASPARLLCRHGHRVFLVGVVKDQGGHILVAVTPLTPRRVIGRLRHAVGLG